MSLVSSQSTNSVQVVIQTAFLGDLILTIPFLNQLKKINPELHLIVICKKGLGSFLLKNNIVDSYIEIEKSDRKSYQLALRSLDKYNILKLYCIHRSIRSLFFSFQIKAKYKVGFNSLLGFFIFKKSFKYHKEWPDPIRKFILISEENSEVKSQLNNQDFSTLNSALPSGELKTIPDFFSFDKLKFNFGLSQSVALFPGSVWNTKRWTIEGFTELTQILVDHNYKVLLLGGNDEKSICEQIFSKVPQAIVLAGQLTIEQSLQKISECALVIGNDSASTHMAGFKNIPCVTIFGPTTLDLGFRPWSNQALVAQNNNLECRPCGAHGHEQCPLGHHNCMKSISAQQVFQLAQKLLNSNSQ